MKYLFIWHHGKLYQFFYFIVRNPYFYPVAKNVFQNTVDPVGDTHHFFRFFQSFFGILGITYFDDVGAISEGRIEGVHAYNAVGCEGGGVTVKTICEVVGNKYFSVRSSLLILI